MGGRDGRVQDIRKGDNMMGWLAGWLVRHMGCLGT